jgi:hypothetical protein
VHWRPKTAADASTRCRPDDVGRTTDNWVHRHADSDMSEFVARSVHQHSTRGGGGGGRNQCRLKDWDLATLTCQDAPNQA